MHVIGHQAVRHDLDAVAFRILTHEHEVGGAIAALEEHGRAVDATLSHMMRHVLENDTRAAGHARTLRVRMSGASRNFSPVRTEIEKVEKVNVPIRDQAPARKRRPATPHTVSPQRRIENAAPLPGW
jgi:hypothetical protein